jgi:hypothetical protein
VRGKAFVAVAARYRSGDAWWPARRWRSIAADHLGIDAEPGVGGEVTAIGQTKPDRPRALPSDRVGRLPGRLDGMGWQAQGPGEDIATASGHGRRRRDARARSACQQPVDDLVDQSVTTEGDDQVDALLDCLLAEGDGVPAMGCSLTTLQVYVPGRMPGRGPR